MSDCIALITAIEGNNNKGEGGKYTKAVPLEDEAITCFSAWRKFGGELKDIPIYALCVNDNPISEETETKLKDLKVDYVEAYHSESKKTDCGYWNVPIAGMLCEQNLKVDYFIHIDLDMTLISTPSPGLFFCGAHDAQVGTLENSTWTRNINVDHKINFETCFICSWRKSFFYNEWYQRLKVYYSMFKERGYLPENREMTEKEDFRWSEIEEFVVDDMYYNKYLNIKPVKDFQISQWYPVDKVDDISKVCFYHDHADTQMMAPILLQYRKRLKAGG